mmetsp:Transcript_35663/g.106419  ORF Transcript_35663/g.106419 Transcript_35663/m.106419 type:complete len:286 (-) Transcript_35663:41-898(-)
MVGLFGSPPPFFLFLTALPVLLSARTNGFNLATTECLQSESRRNFMDAMTRSVQIAALASLGRPSLAAADTGEEEIEVYFGCGCFWHVQHEFAKAEKRILGRADPPMLTARAGYAGGSRGAKNGKVCYHNDKKIADYGTLGHAEVVRLRIPPSSFPAFAEEYVRLFDESGSREDQDGDVGPEYRNIVGVPSGSASKYIKYLTEASANGGDRITFTKGFGDDPDRRAVAFVMDTAAFPFYVAEQYQQFHDGFKKGQNYPLAYNRIAEQLASAKTLGTSRCPNGMLQ